MRFEVKKCRIRVSSKWMDRVYSKQDGPENKGKIVMGLRQHPYVTGKVDLQCNNDDGARMAICI